MDARVCCIRGDTGATATTVNIEVGATGAGDTAIITGPADLLGSAGGVEFSVTEGNLSTVNGVSLGGSDLVVNAAITYTGSATVAPIFELHLLCGRNVI